MQKEKTKTLRPPQYRQCTYCRKSHPAAFYKQHLVQLHGDLLFHCEVCDLLIDRKEFIRHMSYYHTSMYNIEELIEKMKKKREAASQNARPVQPTPAPVPLSAPRVESTPPVKTLSTPNVERTSIPVNKTLSKPNLERPLPVKTLSTTKLERTKTPVKTLPPPKVERTNTAVKTGDKKPPVVVKTKTSIQENDFSDHSDMDDFGPLPESVFDAIEDSQDNQHLQDNSTQSDSNRLSDDSNTSSQSENKNSNNPAQCLENTNNYNCSVVLEPIDIKSTAQNIVIKNNNTNNNLALPTNETSSNTSDCNNLPTNGRAKRNKKRQCPFCPKHYEASSSYFYHLKYFHKGSKEHECEVCARKFGTRSCLTQHMVVHSDHYDFQCKQCQKQFKSKASLYIHEQTHSGTKSWSCSQCHTSFRWKTHLLRHMKRHAPEKGHVCDACGRAFSVRCDLLRHARTHAAGSFSCDRCGQNFAQLRYLKVHLTKQHKIDDRSK